MEGDTATLTLPLKLRFGGGGGEMPVTHIILHDFIVQMCQI